MRPFHLGFSLLLVTVLLSAGCAGYRLTPISVEASKSAHVRGGPHGYIFHAPAPFLLGSRVVKSDGGQEYKFEIVYLPDMERPFRFTQYEFLAKSDLKISFEDGWKFTGAESSTDTTAALDFLTKIAGGLIGIAAVDPNAPSLLLFRIDTSSPDLLTPVELTDRVKAMLRGNPD